MRLIHSVFLTSKHIHPVASATIALRKSSLARLGSIQYFLQFNIRQILYSNLNVGTFSFFLGYRFLDVVHFNSDRHVCPLRLSDFRNRGIIVLIIVLRRLRPVQELVAQNLFSNILPHL